MINSSTVAVTLLAVDLFIVLLNLFPTGNSGVDSLFSLGDESNFTVWYSSLKLSIAAFLVIVISRHFRDRAYSLLAAGFSFLCLSVSETAMLHERLSGAVYTISSGELLTDGGDGIWVLYLAPFIVAAVFVMLRAFVGISKNSPSARLALLCGLSLWLVVPVAETIPRWAGPLSADMAALEVIVEESCELIGATLLIMGLTRVLADQSNICPAAQEATS